MDLGVVIFLTSGLFLGWALGANDAANVFGTAVGTRMIRFATAAIICSVFVVLGAVFSGAGAASTLGKLGAINALGGAFMAALAAALSVYAMTKAGLPVSTTQAIVGSIVGWNLFSDTLTDTASLAKILSTWIICPILAAGFSAGLFVIVKGALQRAKLHLMRTDAYTRFGLILAGAFGAYSLGANNIGNVMGVFVPASPFTDFRIDGILTISSTQQLFLIGALAIGVGVFTYSRRVMLTVGDGLMPLSPIAAWVVVVAHSLVLFLFASQGLEAFLANNGLPTIPLVPVSSSQAVVGAVLGISLVKGGGGIRWPVLGGIGLGWVVTPLLAGLICFVGLFFMQNVFDQQVYKRVTYSLTPAVTERLHKAGLAPAATQAIAGRVFESARAAKSELAERHGFPPDQVELVLRYAEIAPITIGSHGLAALARSNLQPARRDTLRSLAGRHFFHKWTLAETLAETSPAWRQRPDSPANRAHNTSLRSDLNDLYHLFAE